MNERIKYAVVGALIGLGIAALLPGALTLIVGLIALGVGSLAGFLLAAVLLAQSRGEDPANVVQEAVKQATNPDPGAKERPVHQQLLKANQALRLDGNVENVVLTAFEALIDGIRGIVSDALEKSPDSEMTYNVVSLGSTDLPDYVRTYLGLHPAARQAEREGLLQKLKSMADVIGRAKEAIDYGRLDEFQAQTRFLGLKFGAGAAS